MIESKKDNPKGLTSKLTRCETDLDSLNRRVDEMLAENKKVLDEIKKRLDYIEG